MTFLDTLRQRRIRARIWLTSKWSASRLRGAASAAALALTTALAAAFFSFETAQVWAMNNSEGAAFHWVFPAVSASAIFVAIISVFLFYRLVRTSPSEYNDPYEHFAAGVILYAQALHQERRDPALLRLRHNESLTLHVLGFHRERTRLGSWALESAQFLDDRLAIMSILVDDLGWANHMLGNDVAIQYVNRAIEFGSTRMSASHDPGRTLLLAKAHRHSGVINTERTGRLDAFHFGRARELLHQLGSHASRQVESEVAHVDYAEALAIATMVDVNVRGKLRRKDEEGRRQLREAITLVERARNGFATSGDQGRLAKSLVLHVRLLEAAGAGQEAAELAPLRDRAVAASVWARPAGRTAITGRGTKI